MSRDDEAMWKNNLREVRKRRGYTQGDITAAVHIGQTTLSAIERGRISGRKYMDDIARFLRTDAHRIFPYYDYLTYEEAAELLGVSSTLISRRVSEGTIPSIQVGNLRFVSRRGLRGKQLKKRDGPSIKQRVVDCLTEHGSLTTAELLGHLGPFESPDEQQKTKRSLQSILSRGPEFSVDKDVYPPKWSLSGE